MILHRWRCPEGHYEQVFTETAYSLGAPLGGVLRCPTYIGTEDDPVQICGMILVHTVEEV